MLTVYLTQKHSINQSTCEDFGLYRTHKQTNNAEIANYFQAGTDQILIIIYYGNNLNFVEWRVPLPFKPPELACVWSKVVTVNFSEENYFGCRAPPKAKSSEQRLNNRCPAQHAHFIPIVAVGKRGKY